MTRKKVYGRSRERLREYLEAGKISKENYEHITSLLNKLDAKGLEKYSYNRKIKYVCVLSILCRDYYKKDFANITTKEAEAIVIKLRNDYKTPRDYIVLLRIFVKSIYEDGGHKYRKQEYPDVVSYIEPGSEKIREMKKEELITPEEFKLMCDNTTNVRDLCILNLFWETGMRCGELQNLRIKDITVKIKITHYI